MKDPTMIKEGKKVEVLAEEYEEFKSGISWKSLLAVFYSLGIFTPAVIWLNLVTVGVALGSTISFCVLLGNVFYGIKEQ